MRVSKKRKAKLLGRLRAAARKQDSLLYDMKVPLNGPTWRKYVLARDRAFRRVTRELGRKGQREIADVDFESMRKEAKRFHR